MTCEQRKTPGRGTGGISESYATANGSNDTPSLADSVDRGEVFAQMLNGLYIVVAEVYSPSAEPRYRRRFYAGLAAAQRHVDRQRMKGLDAYLFIGQISIIGGDPR